jgi:hypothetical protein
MKNKLLFLIITALSLCLPEQAFSQKKVPGSDMIIASDLESYVSFLASPLLRGRKDGEPGLEIAEQFIVSQAKVLGLRPANGTSYLQPYTLVKTIIDPDLTKIQISGGRNDTVTIQKPVYQLQPTGPANFTVEGEVVFAGYGLRQDKYGYNDYDNIKTEGKILLIMAGAPISEDGKEYLFEGVNWKSLMGLQARLTPLLFTRAKAVLIVLDPKPGYTSIDEQYPGLLRELDPPVSLIGEKPKILDMPNLPKIMFVDRSVADELLKGTGNTLAELQKKIDTDLKAHSFQIPDKKVRITEASKLVEETMYNVAAIVDGSDPVLKDEFVVFSGHSDHIGESSKGINAGADDDASGCAALLSMAEAFQSLEKKPLRSILFLWVSGEEIGLYGSQSYVNNPLVPLDKTVADLNMDMIGRVKGIADTSSENPMSGPVGVFVITDNQSKDLLSIAAEADNNSILDLDYSLSGRNHPLQLFARSDHYNFVKKDIPVLFFTTGLHTDYHTPGDVVAKINFSKLELVTRTMYQIGYTVANRKSRIVVDNPFSKW